MGIENKQHITSNQDNLNDALASLDALLDTPSPLCSQEPENDGPANLYAMDSQDATTPELPDINSNDTRDLLATGSNGIPRAEEQLELPVLSDLITGECHADSAAQESPSADPDNISNDDRDTIRQQALDEVKQHFGSFSDRVVQECMDGFFDDYVENTRRELAAHLSHQLQESLQQVLDDLASLNPADDSRA
jgi:hypothetical protein